MTVWRSVDEVRADLEPHGGHHRQLRRRAPRPPPRHRPSPGAGLRGRRPPRRRGDLRPPPHRGAAPRPRPEHADRHRRAGAAAASRPGSTTCSWCPFTREIAAWSPERFVEEILVGALHAAAVVVGTNFRFGNRAAGDVATLQDAGGAARLRRRGGRRSTAARRCGPRRTSAPAWPPVTSRAPRRRSAVPSSVRGTVQRGDQRGREIGYPTANVPPGETAAPADGVYAGWVYADGEPERLPAAISVGTNPTFAGEREPSRGGLRARPRRPRPLRPRDRRGAGRQRAGHGPLRLRSRSCSTAMAGDVADTRRVLGLVLTARPAPVPSIPPEDPHRDFRAARRPASPEVLRETETWFRKRGLPYFVPEERAAARKALRLRQMLPVLRGGRAGRPPARRGADLAHEQRLVRPGHHHLPRAARRRLLRRDAAARAPDPRPSPRTGPSPGSARSSRWRPGRCRCCWSSSRSCSSTPRCGCSPPPSTAALLWLTVLLFAAVAVAFLLVRLPEEVDGVDDRIDAPLLVSASRGTPMAEAARDLVQNHGDELDLQRDARGPRLRARQPHRGAAGHPGRAGAAAGAGGLRVLPALRGADDEARRVQEAWIGGRDPPRSPGLGNVSVELLQTVGLPGRVLRALLHRLRRHRRELPGPVLHRRAARDGEGGRGAHRLPPPVPLATRRPRTPDRDAAVRRGDETPYPDAAGAPARPRTRRTAAATAGTTEPPAPEGDERLRPRRRTTSGVEVLLDERRDGVDGRLVVAADLDRVALAGAEGHDEQRGAGVDGVVAADGEGDLGVEVGRRPPR